MTELCIREYRPEDVPFLSALWQRCFGDSEALISDFFKLLPQMGIGLAAVYKDKLIGAAYVIDELELVSESEVTKCAYIYAVALDEAFRGLGAGKALTRAAAEKAKARGSAVVCTLPAEPSLYGWYEALISVKPALFRHSRRIKASSDHSPVTLSPAEYMAKREAFLSGQNHIRLSSACLEFQHRLCSEYGGGFYEH